MTGGKETLSNLRISIITSLEADDMNSYEQDVGGSRKHHTIEFQQIYRPSVQDTREIPSEIQHNS